LENTMTIAPGRPRNRDAERARRDALRPLVQEATDALVAAGPGVIRRPAEALALARATAEQGDGCEGRATAGIRTAWAYLASGQVEDAFFALECARDALGGS
jgi:hypothetical protein